CLWCHSPESVCATREVVRYETRCQECGACVEACPIGLRSIVPTLPRHLDRDACQRCGACIDACAHGALEMKGHTATAGEIADRASRLAPFFKRSGGGITLTGGEPTLQWEFAQAVLGLCEADGIHTAVETTGMTPWRRLRLIAAVTDLFLYDLKHSDEDAHRQYTGVSLEPILANLRNLLEMDAEVLVRVPVIPGCNGSPDTIRGIGRHALEAGAERISLLPFNPSASGKYSWLQREYPLEGVKRQGEDEMLFLEHLLRTDGLEVVRA
ncbi:glycyl-radical enzyme activating protein, partial [Candidatus Poribacteria bacterium]|nr:glycyl-radical enzyme activating protein [Candidatus Poribacteria bacterium]